jgi:hypothetical protein
MPFDKKFWITFAVVFVVAMLVGFVNHGYLLAADYEALTPQVMRPLAEQEALFGFQLGAHVLMAFGFTWLYREGHKADKPWLGQGIRFGVAFALAASIPLFIIYHAVANFPMDLMVKQVVFDGIGAMVLGAAAAFTNR